jgi:hypothetical protein
MSKTKNESAENLISSSNDGVILISMSIGIFLIISIFTFFLMKLVVKEHTMSMYHALDIKTRNLAHSALGRGIFQFSNFRNITPQSGQLNNGDYEISYDGVNDEDIDPLPYSHYTMLKSEAEISDSYRTTRIFLSSFPTGFNPAFYSENINNSTFSGSSVNGGFLIKRNGNLEYNGDIIPSEGIVESMPDFNNIYDDEITWTENNVETNTTNAGNNPNNKYLSFDGSNDYVKVNFSTTTTQQTTVPGGTENIVITFEGKSGQLNNGYKNMNWHNRVYVMNGNSYSNSGYIKAVSSGTQVSYNAWNQQNVYFESQDGSEFNFIKLYVAAAWCGSETLTLKGYKNGSHTQTRTMAITNSAGRWSNQYSVAAMNDIDKIVFSNNCWHWAIDDITLTKQLPSTTTSTTTTATTLPQGNEHRTVSAWVRPTNNSNTWGMVQFGTGDCTGKMWGLGRQGGKFSLWGGCKDWVSNLSIPTNEWSFVVLRYNGTKVRAYVNGVWEETTLNGFNTQISELFIGAETTNNGSSFRSYFKGGIDEVAVWNEAITNAEILALYNNGAGRDASTNSGGYTSKSNLKGYWKFNDGSGSTVSDASGNGKNGTKYGATWMTGSHHQPQPGPLVFNAGTQLNLNSPNCGSDHTSLCTNNKIAVNQNIIFTDTDITGVGTIVAAEKITIEQNSTVGGGITLIAKEIEINNSSLGNSSLFNSASGPVIIYTEDGGTITNSSNVAGLMINYDTNNSASFSFDNSTIHGAVLNYGSNFQLNNSTNIIGSVVSNYLVTINSSSSITKGNLPSFYGQNIGLPPSVIPGSYLEY